jgi:hypothetical protein
VIGCGIFLVALNLLACAGDGLGHIAEHTVSDRVFSDRAFYCSFTLH